MSTNSRSSRNKPMITSTGKSATPVNTTTTTGLNNRTSKGFAFTKDVSKPIPNFKGRK